MRELIDHTLRILSSDALIKKSGIYEKYKEPDYDGITRKMRLIFIIGGSKENEFLKENVDRILYLEKKIIKFVHSGLIPIEVGRYYLNQLEGELYFILIHKKLDLF